MASMVLGDSTLESLTPSVNAPLSAYLIFLYLTVHGQRSGGGVLILDFVISKIGDFFQLKIAKIVGFKS
jgi:hypothetical protein